MKIVYFETDLELVCVHFFYLLLYKRHFHNKNNDLLTESPRVGELETIVRSNLPVISMEEIVGMVGVWY